MIHDLWFYEFMIYDIWYDICFFDTRFMVHGWWVNFGVVHDLVIMTYVRP